MTATPRRPHLRPTRLIDSTLRDGSHAISHQYTVEQVEAIVKGLDGAVQVIEVAHGDGLGGSSFNYGFSAVDEMKLVEAAVKVHDQRARSPACCCRHRHRRRPQARARPRRGRRPASPCTAPRPTSPSSTSRWPGPRHGGHRLP